MPAEPARARGGVKERNGLTDQGPLPLNQRHRYGHGQRLQRRVPALAEARRPEEVGEEEDELAADDHAAEPREADDGVALARGTTPARPRGALYLGRSK